MRHCGFEIFAVSVGKLVLNTVLGGRWARVTYEQMLPTSTLVVDFLGWLQFSYELLILPEEENRCIQRIVLFEVFVGRQLRKRILSNRLLMYQYSWFTGCFGSPGIAMICEFQDSITHSIMCGIVVSSDFKTRRPLDLRPEAQITNVFHCNHINLRI